MRDLLAAALTAQQPVELPLGGLRPAAVMLLIAGPPSEEHIVFQVRTQLVEEHKGQISLPGGRRDPSDASYLHTALRETNEEVGVPPDAIEVLGALDDIETVVTGYLVRPYVGVLAQGVTPSITAQREVAELLHVPVAHLLDERSHIWWPVDRDGEVVPTRAYEYGEYVIWGATARILENFEALLNGNGGRG